MKKILFVSMLLASCTVMAQGLFPELAGLDGREKNTKKAPVAQVAPAENLEEEHMPEIKLDATALEVDADVEIVDESADVEEVNAESEVDLFAQKTENVETKKVDTEAQEEEKDEEDELKIIVYLTSAEVVTPPNQNFAYCFGDLKFANTLKRPVQVLDFDLAYGPFVSTYKVRNLVKGTEQTDSFGLAGDACNLIMDMPKMEVKRCVVEGMDEAVCKKKVIFIPLNE